MENDIIDRVTHERSLSPAIPFMRKVVFRLARLLGKATKAWRAFPMVFIPIMFLLLPLIVLGLTSCFDKQTKGFTALGVFMLLLIVGSVAYFVYWWRYKEGSRKFLDMVDRRRRRATAMLTLADDLDYIKVDVEYCKNEIGRIKDFAGMAVPPRVVQIRPATGDEEDQLLEPPNPEDDQVTLYESCISKPWRDVMLTAAGSIRSGLGST